MRIFRPPLRPRVGLLGKFAFTSLLPIVLLGLVLAHVLRGEVRQRALVNAREAAALLDRTLVQPQLTPHDLRAGLTTERVRALDRTLQASLDGKQIARIKIWNRSGRAIYASDHALIGKVFAPSDELRDALGGETASEVSDLEKAENAGDRRYGQLLEVYTPLRFAQRGAPSGAFEVYLPYRPIAASIAHDTRQLSLVLLGGLALLYLALFRIVARASTTLRRQAAENEHLALHDRLTELPNRTLFHDRAAQAVRTARRARSHAALMILDLDRFKEVNDTLGHHNGDLLLNQIGPRLRGVLRDSDSVARLGGDEFGVLLPTITDGDDALAVAHKIREALHDPVTINGINVDVAATVGIALFPDHGTDVETLLQRADVAMYVAKEDHSGCELYRPERDEYSPARLSLVADLRRAIDQDELVLHYQPKAELRSGRVVGVEALIRWQHPEHGLLFPDQFVPLAERTGLIKDLTLAVLEGSLRQLRAWHDDGLELRISVNVSARDLLDAELPETVARLLHEYAVGPDRLELEITESVILADPMKARLVLNRLNAMGVGLAIDDFGSGYSSLAYLKRLPVRQIKIDRSFVMNMEQDENDAVIVRSTIDLGRNLGLQVVAEGVESEAIWSDLAQLNCDLAQGYYLSRPIPSELLAEWVRTRSGPTASVSAAPPLDEFQHPAAQLG